MPLPLQDAIRAAFSTVLPGRPPVAHIHPVSRPGGRHPGIWRVILQDNTPLIAKHQPFAPFTRGKPHDLLQVEQRACALLSGAPVPRVYGISPDHSLIFLEDCGPTTLDDFCQETDSATRTALAPLAVDGFLALQETFRTHTSALAPYAFPGCAPEGLRKSWTEATGHLPNRLSHLLERLAIPASPETLSRASRTLSHLLTTLSAAEPLLGPTDYNARNIVVDPPARALRFIELSKLGWDWPERRLVQYTASSGSGRPDGTFRTLLTRPLAARSSSPETLDGHHLVYHLLAADALTTALSTPSSLLTAWQNSEGRLKDLHIILSTPLSGHPLTTELRTLFTP